MNDARTQRHPESGSTYIEVLAASVLLAFGMLTMVNMFLLGYTNVQTAGRSTVGLSAARQLMEDVRRLPYDDLARLDGFDTDNSATLPSSGPAREIARRWRYALAGEGVGWDFSDEERERWAEPTDDRHRLGAAGTIDVTARSATLTEVTILVTVPGRFRGMQMSTLIARM